MPLISTDSPCDETEVLPMSFRRPCRGGRVYFAVGSTGSASLHPWLLSVAPLGRGLGRVLARRPRYRPDSVPPTCVDTIGSGCRAFVLIADGWHEKGVTISMTATPLMFCFLVWLPPSLQRHDATE